MLVETGLADHVLPELPMLKLERDEHHRHKDVYEHTLIVLEQAIDLEDRLGGEPDFVSRFAALMHDVGKPKTRKFLPDGTVTFHHHDVVGAKITRKRMQALRFSGDEIDAVSHLVELHLRFHGYGSGEWTDSAVRRYVRDAGDQLARLHVLTRADCTTRNARKADRLRRTYDDLEARIARLSEEEELALTGPTSTATRSCRSSRSRRAARSARPTSSCSSSARQRPDVRGRRDGRTARLVVGPRLHSEPESPVDVSGGVAEVSASGHPRPRKAAMKKLVVALATAVVAALVGSARHRRPARRAGPTRHR